MKRSAGAGTAKRGAGRARLLKAIGGLFAIHVGAALSGIAVAALFSYVFSGCANTAELKAGGKLVTEPARREVIVIVHGWNGSERRMKRLSRELNEALGVPAYICELPGRGTTRHIDEYAGDLADYVEGLELDDSTDVNYVGFSMGGLVVRYHVQINGARAKRLITVCTPNYGTKHSKLPYPSDSKRDMVIGCEFLRELNAAELPGGTEVHAVWLDSDLVVQPPFSGRLEGVKCYKLKGANHWFAPGNIEIITKVAGIFRGTAEPEGPQEFTEEQKQTLQID